MNMCYLDIHFFNVPQKDPSERPNCRSRWDQSGWCHTKFCCDGSQKYQRKSQVNLCKILTENIFSLACL